MEFSHHTDRLHFGEVKPMHVFNRCFYYSVLLPVHRLLGLTVDILSLRRISQREIHVLCERCLKTFRSLLLRRGHYSQAPCLSKRGDTPLSQLSPSSLQSVRIPTSDILEF